MFDAATVTLNPAIDRTVTIPRFTAGSVNRVTADHSTPGGKGVNVAARLAESGLAVAATGFLGEENAAPFEQLFARLKIDDQFLRIAGATRVGIKIVDPESGQTTDINFPGVEVTKGQIEAVRRAALQLDSERIVLAGSLPPGVDPTFYRDLIAPLRQQGRRVFMDASGESLRLALEAAPHVIKPNVHELGELLGHEPTTPAEVVTAARELIARGIELVVVSMGAEGACFVTADEALLAIPPAIEVHSTVGAGDAMVAGLVAAHAQSLPLADTARLATAFSVHALSPTTATTFPDAVQQLLTQVTLRNLS